MNIVDVIMLVFLGKYSISISYEFSKKHLTRIAAFPKGDLCLQLQSATFHCQTNVLSTTSLEVCFLSIWCLYYNNIYIITCANM